MQLYEPTRNIHDDRRATLEKRFINSIIDFWKKEVIGPLLDVTDPDTLLVNILKIRSNFESELVKRVDDHLTRILKLGLYEASGELRESGIIKEELLQKALTELKENSYIEKIISTVNNRLNDRLLRLEELSEWALDQVGQKELTDALKQTSYTELQKFESAMRVESQYAVHVGRELNWTARDPNSTFRYRWGRGKDHRSTECCAEIEETVNEEARENGEKGVTLERLKEIVAIIGRKHFPKFTQRPFVPHWGCRSGAERVVI